MRGGRSPAANLAPPIQVPTSWLPGSFLRVGGPKERSRGGTRLGSASRLPQEPLGRAHDNWGPSGGSQKVHSEKAARRRPRVRSLRLLECRGGVGFVQILIGFGKPMKSVAVS